MSPTRENYYTNTAVQYYLATELLFLFLMNEKECYENNVKHIDIKFQGCKDVFSLFFRHCQRKHIPDIGEVSIRKQSNN